MKPGQNGVEQEFRIFPVGPVGPGYVPRRMYYPADELRINEANYTLGVNLLGGPDDLKTHVWWDL